MFVEKCRRASVNPLGFMSIPQRVMDSTHFRRKFRGSGHSAKAEIAESRVLFEVPQWLTQAKIYGTIQIGEVGDRPKIPAKRLN
jgi:hypothetical protein